MSFGERLVATKKMPESSVKKTVLTHDKKRILITGSGSGIGQGIALFLAERGHHLLVSDVSLDSAQQTVDMIKISGGSAQAYQLNVTSQNDIQQLINGLEKPVDVLVNNAGIQHVEPLETFPIEQWDRLIQVLLVGVARLTQAVLPGMLSNNFGRVINIGSIHALVASPYKSAYVAAKHGLIGFAKTLALEVADKDITINTLCPAYVLTPLVEKQIAAQAKEHGLTEEQVIEQIMLKPMPKKSFIEIAELAGCCDFLLSKFAKNITAQAITLDGGWTAQ